MKLIDKDALVAEIERKQEEVSYCENGSFASWVDENYYFTLETIKSLIDTLDTLEVKDVDLEKEIKQSFINLDYHLDAYNRVEDYVGENINMVEYKRIAKYFFELGLKAQKGE